MPQITNTDTNSQLRALSGLSQRIVDPANPASMTAAQYHPSPINVLIPIAFTTTSYSKYLPDGAFIKSVQVIPTVGFSSGALMSLGRTVGASDLLVNVDLTQQSISILATPVLDSALSRNQVQNVRPLWITLSGSLSAGSGYVLIEYLNT